MDSTVADNGLKGHERQDAALRLHAEGLPYGEIARRLWGPRGNKGNAFRACRRALERLVPRDAGDQDRNRMLEVTRAERLWASVWRTGQAEDWPAEKVGAAVKILEHLGKLHGLCSSALNSMQSTFNTLVVNDAGGGGLASIFSDPKFQKWKTQTDALTERASRCGMTLREAKSACPIGTDLEEFLESRVNGNGANGHRVLPGAAGTPEAPPPEESPVSEPAPPRTRLAGVLPPVDPEDRCASCRGHGSNCHIACAGRGCDRCDSTGLWPCVACAGAGLRPDPDARPMVIVQMVGFRRETA